MRKQKPQSEENSDTHIETAKEQAFLNEYFRLGMNGTRAWMSTHPKSSYAAAAVSASEYLKSTKIRAAVAQRFRENAMSAEEVLSRLGDIARGTHYPFIRISDDGFVYFDFANPEAERYLHLIKKIKTKRERRIDGSGENQEEWEGEWVEVELHDAQTALVTLAKYHKLLVDRMDVTTDGEKIKGYIGFSPDQWDGDAPQEQKPDDEKTDAE